MKRFRSKEAIYIRPMYWAEEGGVGGSSVPPNPETTRFLLCLYVAPMNPAERVLDHALALPPAVNGDHADRCQGGLPLPEQCTLRDGSEVRGFDNALVLDMLGNVAEAGTSNLFMVKDGVVKTPALNGTFLAGITAGGPIELSARCRCCRYRRRP